MIYRLLKFLCKITLRAYFRRMKIVGLDRVPENVPCIFIANHPSAFMDPIIVATTVRQPVYFVAAGEYVGTGLKGWFFKKFLHMIPVFRPSTRPDDVHKNKLMFEHCFDHLVSGGSLLIFPEGVSVTERRIKPFKTGVARIARGAELRSQAALNLHIVPVGLNYSNPHRFRSDLFVHIGVPVKVEDHVTALAANEAEEVGTLTLIAEQALLDAVIHLESDEDDSLLSKLETVYSRDLKAELGIDYREQEKEFRMQKEMARAIHFFKTSDPGRFEQVRKMLDTYVHRLRYYGFTDKHIHEVREKRPFRRVFTYITGFPVFILGAINNLIPYFIVDLLMRRLRTDDTFRGSMQLAVGLFTYLFFYTGVSIAIGLFTPAGWFALLYPLVMYASGIYALLYLTAIRHSKQRNRLRERLHADHALLIELVAERRELIKTLDRCRTDFEQARV